MDRTHTPPTPENLALAHAHPAFFTDRFAFCHDPNEPWKGNFRLRLWVWQWELLNLFTQRKRVIVLKARQMGVSWLLASYAAWTFVTKPGSVILFISKREEEAKSLLSKMVFIISHLPDELRPPVSKKDTDSGARFHSALLNSTAVALPATKDAGRSETATLVIPDEWAYQDEAETMFGAYEPTLGMHGEIKGTSTAQGTGNFFYKVYQAAKRSENDFCPVFLPWFLRPGRTRAWHGEKRRQFESQGTPELLSQEYPEDDLEAFSASINLFFPLSVQRAFLANSARPLRTMDLGSTEEGRQITAGEWRIYQEPLPFRRYVLGADVAEGVVGGNYSTAIVLDPATGLVVATVRCHMPPDVFGGLLARVGEFYNQAVIVVERNNHGILTLNTLEHQLSYPRLWRPEHRVSRYSALTPLPDPGWTTNVKTKPEMLFLLRQAMTDGSFIAHDSWLASELPYFQQVGTPPSRVVYQAASGTTDDMIIAAGIANACRSATIIIRRGVRRPARGLARR